MVVTWAFWILSIVARRDPLPGAQSARRRERRDRRSGVHALPLQQLARRPVLAADPAVRGLRVPRGRPAQVRRVGLDRRHRRGDRSATGQNAVAIPAQGRPPITFEWYRDFLNLLINNNASTWFAWAITLGEIAVGIGLIIGLFTGVAAFFGALMNVSYLLAGSTSTNPVLFTLAIGLMLAWKTAGYYGLDRYLLPMLGTPWKPSVLKRTPASTSTPAPLQS